MPAARHITIGHRLTLGGCKSALPWGGSGAARPCRAIFPFIIGLVGTAAVAQNAEPMDQFIVVPIPEGIELEPKVEYQTDRGLTFDRGSISEGELVAFAKAICRNDTAEIEFHDPSWGQWLRGKVPARATC